MKTIRIFLMVLIAVGLVCSSAFAAGDVAKGKAMFNDAKFAGGKKSCSSCHPDGKGLEKAGAKSDLKTPAGPAKSLEEAINICIVKANGGKAIDAKSEQMQDVVAYIKSLGKKTEKKSTGGY